MRRIFTLLLFVFCVLEVTAIKTISYREKPKGKDSLIIREGVLCQTALRIKYRSLDGTRALIQLSEPVMVAQAEQDERWGFFQFPSIGKADDGTLIVSWQMKEDSHKMYGKSSGRECVPMISKDGGCTWLQQDKDYFIVNGNNIIPLKSGERLQVITPEAKDIYLYEDFPQAVVKGKQYTQYLMNSLPEELQGVYLERQIKGHKSEKMHAKLYDPGLLRYSIDGLMPILWSGNLKQLADQSLLAGVYPCSYIDSLGRIKYDGISFYQSFDNAHSWEVIGKIPPIYRQPAHHNDRIGFYEPAYEILKDSSFICVMRTGSTSPMYKSFSQDFGKTWSIPVPFTPNGVNPKLLLLKNGVLVLVSGRPGVQLRFSFDGMGRVWSDPIDMIPFMNSEDSYKQNVSCGYASIMEAGNNAFYVVYSDFTTEDSMGRVRKSIRCRKVIVNTSSY